MKKNVLIFILGCGFISCKQIKPNETENEREVIINDLNESLEVLENKLVECENTRVETKIVEVNRVPKRIWCGKELNLPKGRVINMDCSNCNDVKLQNIKDNYITIESSDGYLRVIKDIDEDMYLNFQVNDSIN